MNRAGKFAFMFFLAPAVWAQAQQSPVSTSLPPTGMGASGGRRVVEILADKDSRFKIAGSDRTPLLLTVGEAVTLRITAVRAKEIDREGSVHGFVLLDRKGNRVPGWSLQLKPGTRDYELVAPAGPGDYQVVCNVICSADHERMRLKVKVLPQTQSAKE